MYTSKILLECCVSLNTCISLTIGSEYYLEQCLDSMLEMLRMYECVWKVVCKNRNICKMTREVM